MPTENPDITLLNRLFEYSDGMLFWKINYFKFKKGTRAGNLHHSGYRRVGLGRKLWLEHRIIYFMHNHEMPAEIDHINGVKADNRIENLRKATRCENCCNRGPAPDNKTGYKNVNFNKSLGKYVAQITHNKKKLHIGLYDSAEEANASATDARENLHRDFAWKGGDKRG